MYGRGSSPSPANNTLPQIPQPPNPLTAGLPDPATITKQKEAYLQMLEDQLRQGVLVLDAQVKHQRSYLIAQADQQKKQFTMQIDMEVKQQDMVLQQQYAEQALALQVQASQQKAALEQQALQLSMEYQAKKQEEKAMRQQYEMDLAQHEMQNRIQAEMQKLGVSMSMVSGGTIGVHAPPHMGHMHHHTPQMGGAQQQQQQQPRASFLSGTSYTPTTSPVGLPTQGGTSPAYAAPNRYDNTSSQSPIYAAASRYDTSTPTYAVQPEQHRITYVYGPNGELVPKQY